MQIGLWAEKSEICNLKSLPVGLQTRDLFQEHRPRHLPASIRLEDLVDRSGLLYGGRVAIPPREVHQPIGVPEDLEFDRAHYAWIGVTVMVGDDAANVIDLFG